jgi:hypothetical protein
MVMTNGLGRHVPAINRKLIEESDENSEEYQSTEDYKILTSVPQINTKTKIRRKEKSTIAPKLQNLLLRNSPQS